MLLFVDTKSGVPIYDQIVTQIKELMMNGELKEDDALPSIRSLAKELRISVITTKRAYEELEREKLIYTVPSKGCFVAGHNSDLLREARLREMEAHITEIIRLAKSCRLTTEELIEMLKTEAEELL